ncbi:MAG TPA: hypothetical protein VG742_12400 [Dongiaceae bacterium]|nr:hypothetical protein [Dongiaceae bacterium]
MNCNLPREFNEGLKLLALLARRMREAGAAEPVVIGASAVEIHSNGAYPCGDIEITVQDVALCQEELIRIGFHPDDPKSAKRRHWNEDLWIGIRISARVPFLGRALSARQISFETGCGPVRVISLEDTIAALIAVFDANPRQHRDQLEQATHLYKTAGALNRNYLDLRLRDETMGGRSLTWFVGLTAQRTAVARWG